MRRKVNKADSKRLRGRDKRKGLSDTTGSPGGGGEGQEQRYRLPPPPAQRQGTAGWGVRRQQPVDMNGHPGRVTSRDTDRTEAPRGFPTVDRPESGSFPGGHKCGAARSLHYTPEEMTRRPNWLGAFPAGRLTAAVTSAPRPTRRPAQPVVSQPPRLPSSTWLPAVAAHRSRPGCGGGDCFRKRRPARPAAGASGRCRSPPPPPAGRLTSSSGSSSSFFRSRRRRHRRHCRPKRHFRSSRPISSAWRSGRGRKARPSRGRAGRRGEVPPPLGYPAGQVTVSCPPPPRAATFSSGGVFPKLQLQVPPLRMLGEGGCGLPGPLAWAFQSLPTTGRDSGEKLWGLGIDRCPRRVSGPPPASPA